MKTEYYTSSKSIMALGLLAMLSCKPGNKTEENTLQEETMEQQGPFKEDVDFLKEYEKDLVVLQSGNGMVAVAPRLQGRVMTSSAKGWGGDSYGWINRPHYQSGEINPQINVYGGEERFWLGPEGGQYSIFFEKGADFTFDQWKTPRLLDLEPFDVLEQSEKTVSFSKSASLTNYQGFTFDMKIDRMVQVLSDKEALSLLGVASLEGLDAVAYKTENKLTNVGDKAWEKKSGLLSIWMLGMFKHSPTTTVVIPYVQTGEEPVNIYESFGSLSDDRLVTNENRIYFKADGEYRSKIGLSPESAKDVLGSYDAENAVLTIVKYNKPEGAVDYVNSKWEIQDAPYEGDVVNSYNDGAVDGGKPLGPFYELETSSPGAALAPKESLTHIQYTFHLVGDKEQLNAVSREVFGVSLDEIAAVFDN
ncbi:hypothetical protein GCM10028791_37940 [Echinicola sediminis]